MATKKRPSLTKLTSGLTALSSHAASKGGAHDSGAAKQVAADKSKATGKPRYMQIRLSDEDFRRMSVMSAELGVSLQSFGLEALNAHRKANGYPGDLTGPPESRKDR